MPSDRDPASVPTGEDVPAAGPDPTKGPLFIRWQEPAPDQLAPRHVEARRLAEAMRTIIEALAATAAPLETLTAAADALEAVAVRFVDLEEEKIFDGFAEAANIGGDLFALFERSPFMGRANPLSPPIALREKDGTIEGRGTFGSAYEGPPGCVHGGYVAGAFDEILGATQSLAGNPGMTGTLTVRYRSPTPLHAELHFIGELVKVEGRKIFTEGRVFAGERLCAEAEAVFISMKPGTFLELARQRSEQRVRSAGAAGETGSDQS